MVQLSPPKEDAHGTENHAEARGGLTHGRVALALRLAPLQPAVLFDDLQLEAQRARDAPIAVAQAAPLVAAVLAPWGRAHAHVVVLVHMLHVVHVAHVVHVLSIPQPMHCCTLGYCFLCVTARLAIVLPLLLAVSLKVALLQLWYPASHSSHICAPHLVDIPRHCQQGDLEHSWQSATAVSFPQLYQRICSASELDELVTTTTSADARGPAGVS